MELSFLHENPNREKKIELLYILFYLIKYNTKTT